MVFIPENASIEGADLSKKEEANAPKPVDVKGIGIIRKHLLEEGFREEEIELLIESGEVRYLATEEESLSENFKASDKDGKLTTSTGIQFFFSKTFSQLRCDNPISAKDGKKAKYLTPFGKKIDTTCAYTPPGFAAVTEGLKDSKLATLRTGIPIAGVAGVTHIQGALPKNKGTVVIFDNDGWSNPSVIRNLLTAAKHLNGKVNLIPDVPDEPNAGFCEWFKHLEKQALEKKIDPTEHQKEQTQKLIDDAMSIKKFINTWSEKLDRVPSDKLSDTIKILAIYSANLELTEVDREAIINQARKSSKVLTAKVIRDEFDKAVEAYKKKQKAEEKKAADEKNKGEEDKDEGLISSGWNPPESHPTKSEIGRFEGTEDGLVWKPLTNFDFQIKSVLEGVGEDGALELIIKRSLESKEYTAIIDCKKTTLPRDFLDALKEKIGVNLVSNLDIKELNALLTTREEAYLKQRLGKKFRRIQAYGQQGDGVWVFKDRQFKKDGSATNADESLWVFDPNLGTEDFISAPEPAEPNPSALKNLLDACQDFFGDRNFYQVVLAMGWTVAGLHSQEMVEKWDSFPLLNLSGEAGSAKTIAAETMLSLIGKNWWHAGMLSKASTSALYEHGSKLGSLPICWDDPPRSPEWEELMKTWFNRKARLVRGNCQKPKAPLAVTSNHVAGGDQAAAFTRFVRLPFERATGGNKEAYQQLKVARDQASGSLPQLLAIGCDFAAINQLETELLHYLHSAHARVAQSLAITLHYTQKVLALAGRETESVKQWVIDNLCEAENDEDNAGDSLRDFAEKLLSLESEGLVGDWNLQRGKEFVAIHHAHAWGLVDSKFSPKTYNKKSLQSLILKAGGNTRYSYRFAKTRDEVLAYKRLLLNNEAQDLKKPETTPRSAWLIPLKYFEPCNQKRGGVIKCNHGLITPQNLDEASVSDPNSSGCNHVIKKNIDIEEERQDTPQNIEPQAIDDDLDLEGEALESDYSDYNDYSEAETSQPQGFEGVIKNDDETDYTVDYTQEDDYSANVIKPVEAEVADEAPTALESIALILEGHWRELVVTGDAEKDTYPSEAEAAEAFEVIISDYTLTDVEDAITRMDCPSGKQVMRRYFNKILKKHEDKKREERNRLFGLPIEGDR